MTTTDGKRLARLREQREARGLHDLLTTEEAAALMGVSESTLKHGRRRADLPTPVTVLLSSRIYYRRDDVERWADRRAQGAAYPPARAARG